jgi:hypothetical protein
VLKSSLFYLLPFIILLIVAGGYFVQTKRVGSGKASSLVAVSPSPVVTPSQSPSPSPTVSPAVMLKSASPKPSALGESTSSKVMVWKYPNSSITSSSDSSLTLESSDDPTTITSWYKDKIQSGGMNIKTFVSTNSNGNILNKLSGAGSMGVQIEISKSEGEAITKIVVKLST